MTSSSLGVELFLTHDSDDIQRSRICSDFVYYLLFKYIV